MIPDTGRGAKYKIDARKSQKRRKKNAKRKLVADEPSEGSFRALNAAG